VTKRYRLFLLAVFAIPLLVMLLIYIKIFLVIKGNELKRKNMGTTSSRDLPLVETNLRTNPMKRSFFRNIDRFTSPDELATTNLGNVIENPAALEYERAVDNCQGNNTDENNMANNNANIKPKEDREEENKDNSSSHKPIEKFNSSSSSSSSREASIVHNKRMNSVLNNDNQERQMANRTVSVSTTQETRTCLNEKKRKWYHRVLSPLILRRTDSNSCDTNSISTSVTNGSLIRRNPIIGHQGGHQQLDSLTDMDSINGSVFQRERGGNNTPEMSPITSSLLRLSLRNRTNNNNISSIEGVGGHKMSHRMTRLGRSLRRKQDNKDHDHLNSSHVLLRRSRSHSKALFTTLIILGTYLFCWMPAVLFMAATCQDGCPWPLLSMSPLTRASISITCNYLVVFKAIVDPFIYTLRMKEMQSAIRRMRPRGE